MGDMSEIAERAFRQCYEARKGFMVRMNEHARTEVKRFNDEAGGPEMKSFRMEVCAEEVKIIENIRLPFSDLQISYDHE
jgi:hypothetical protein